jgi:transcriptional regulator with XRE-family HTH domain
MTQPNLGKKIADLRKAKGLTQEELVEKCNISVRTLQRIESGEGSPRSYTLRIIFDALDYSQVDSNEISSNSIGSIISFRLEQFYRYFIDLFNLKTNTMKKLTILSIMFSVMFVGTFMLITEIKAQKTDKNSNKNTATKSVYKTNRDMVVSNFSCDECFEQDGNTIGRNVKFEHNGTKISAGLISINKSTREFNVGFAKGKFMEQLVEITIEQSLLTDSIIKYSAEKVTKSDDKISLSGNAKLIYGKNNEGIIETGEIIIHIKQ